MRRTMFLLLVCLLAWPLSSRAALPSNEQWRLALLNECQGFGCAALQALDYSTWSLCTVSNLNASGAGSLHACATSGTSHWIVFSVSGNITLTSTLFPTSNKVIDGRGADITLYAGGINIQTDQVVVAYLKFHNTTLTNVMLQATNNADNSWFHHNTFQNPIDEVIYVGSTACTGVTPPTTVTISWNHFPAPNAESNGAATSDCDPAEWCNKAILVSNSCGGIPAVDAANTITMHHNHFQTEVRHPVSNWATIHAFNNYYHNTDYGPQACTETNMLSENDIWDRYPGSANPMGGSSVPLCGSGFDTGIFAVTGAYLLDGATYIEDQPGSVFNPDSFYTSAPETANETLRLALIAGAGWQAVTPPVGEVPSLILRLVR